MSRLMVRTCTTLDSVFINKSWQAVQSKVIKSDQEVDTVLQHIRSTKFQLKKVKGFAIQDGK